MRIALCVKRDLMGTLVLNRLLPRLIGHEVGLFFSVKERPQEGTCRHLRLMAVLERRFPLDVLFPRLEERRASPPGAFLTIGELIRSHGLEAQDVRSLKPGLGAAQLAEFRPDLILSIRFSLIFPPALLTLPRLGILNVHPGALPAYGGLFAPFWQMRDGRPRLGCSVHWVDEGIDTGPLVSLGDVPHDPARSVLSHAADLYEVGVEMAADAVAQLAEGRPLPGRPQDAAARGYFTFPTPVETQDFLAAGGRLASWADVRALYGAFAPGPGLDGLLLSALAAAGVADLLPGLPAAEAA